MKFNHKEIIPSIFEANLYFSITNEGDFMFAVIVILVNLLEDEDFVEIFALISINIDFNWSIEFLSDLRINLYL